MTHHDTPGPHKGGLDAYMWCKGVRDPANPDDRWITEAGTEVSDGGAVKLMPERDEEALWLTGATASCGSFGAGDLGPDREGLLACGPVLGGGDVIAAEVEEVVDLVVGREKPLRLAG
jgi:hypothetical protein